MTRPAWPSLRNGPIELRRSAGKLARLEEVIASHPLEGDYGIGHTRWATHGRPTEENAHPHVDCTGRIVVVHNGIIENYLDLKQQLQKEGHTFVTETDTEIVAHLIEREMKDDGLENATRRALLYMRGLFALVLMSADDPNKIVTVRNGPPIVVGLGDGEFFVASDIPAILSHTRDVVFLGDEEMAVITPAGVEFTDYSGRAVSNKSTRVAWDPVMAEKAGYKHFMLKEIFEQPMAIKETVLGRASIESGKVFLHEIKIPDEVLRETERVVILACGTSWHSALVGEVHDRVDRADPGRCRLRLRVSLPRPDRLEEHARGRDHAVRRDRRHPRGTARGEEEGGPQHLDLQRRRQHGDPRDGRHRLHACGPGDRRGFDQGVHLAAGRAAPAGAVPRPDPRHAVTRAGAPAHRRA